MLGERQSGVPDFSRVTGMSNEGDLLIGIGLACWVEGKAGVDEFYIVSRLWGFRVV